MRIVELAEKMIHLSGLSVRTEKSLQVDMPIAVDHDDYARVRQILRETVSGYTPDGDIVDWIYQQRRLEP